MSLRIGLAVIAAVVAGAATGRADAASVPCVGQLAAGTYADVVVESAQTCTVGPNVEVLHDLVVHDGGSLKLDGATVGHDIRATTPASIEIGGASGGATVGHDISIDGLTGGATSGPNYICDTHVGHDLAVVRGSASAASWIIGDKTDVCAAGNVVGHDLSVSKNANRVDVSNNTVEHDIAIAENSAQAIVSANSAGHDATCTHDEPEAVGVANAAANNDTCPTAPAASLTITISGLPDGILAPVTATGPYDFTRSVSASATLGQLIAGDYTVTAGSVSARGNTYTATIAGSPATLAAGSSGQISIDYAITITPGEAATVTGPATAPIKLIVSAAAFPDGARLQIAPDASPDTSAPAGSVGPAFTIDTTTEPAVPVELDVPYDPAASGPASGVSLAWWSDATSTWQGAATTYDASRGVLVADVPHLSTFAWVTDGRVTPGPTYVIPPSNGGAPFTDCPALGIIGSRGSGENDPGNAEAWAEGLGPPDDAFALDLGRTLSGIQTEYTYNPSPGYPAVDAINALDFLNGGTTYFDSARSGAASLLTMVADEVSKCPNTVLVLTGYSQGAELTADMYENLVENGPAKIFDRIGGIVLFGDPQYDHNDSAGQVTGLTNDGIFTSYPWYLTPHAFASSTQGRVLSYCIPTDLVCQGAGQALSSLAEKALTGDLPHAMYVSLGFAADAATYFASRLSYLQAPPSYWSSPSSVTVTNDGTVAALPFGYPYCSVQPPSGPCAVTTGFGLVAGGDRVELNGMSSFIPLSQPFLLPIPNSDAVFTIGTAPPWSGGINLFYYKNFLDSITTYTDLFGNVVRYAITKPPDARVTDANGNLLALDYNAVNFSNNGKWLVSASPVSLLRINLDQLQTFAFGGPTSYDIGIAPNYHTAITDDGRYFAINQPYGGSGLNLEDLNNCSPPSSGSTVNGILVTGQQCQTIDVETAIKNVLPGYVIGIPWQFTDDRTLIVYAGYNDANGIRRIAKLTIRSSG